MNSKEIILKKNIIPDAYRICYLANHFLGPILPEFKKKWNLTRTEYNILHCLAHADGITAREICEVTGRPKNSVSRAVDSLMEKFYITSMPDPEDGRKKRLFITEKGDHLFREAVVSQIKREKEMLACLKSSDRRSLKRLLTKLIDSSDDWAGIY